MTPVINVTLADSGFKKSIKPDPLYTVSQWADNRRVLPKESSSEYGRWRTSRFPFVREIMDSLSPSDPVEEVKFMKGTQIGGTEIGNNFLMCYADLYPSPSLLVLPTETLAKGHVKKKLNPSLRAIKSLRQKIKRGKTKDDIGETFIKEYAGGSITIGWSNSQANYRSASIRALCLDDIDGFPDDVDGDGDPVSLAKKRTDTFSNRKIYINSTPTIQGSSKIEKEFEDSDQRHYYMLCPHCSGSICFELNGFIFDYDKKSYSLVGDARYACEHCGSLIDEYHKSSMMSEENGAKWVAHNEGHIHRGYRLPSYYSPVGFLSWNRIFREFLKAKKQMNRGDTRLMKVWKNTVDANAWEEEYQKVQINDYEERLEIYTSEVPKDVFVLSAGIDSQNDRYEIEVVGFGKDDETWGIDYKIINGDPNLKSTRDALDLYLKSLFVHESGSKMKIYSAGLDTGGHRTDAGYSFCKPRYHRRIFALKGATSITAPITTGRYSRSNKGRVPLFSIGVNSAKDDILANLQITEVGQNYMHYPQKECYGEVYFKQLTAERKNGEGRWINPTKRRNEALDCRVYAKAALAISGLNVEKLEKPIFYIETKPKNQKRRRILSRGVA